MMRADPIMLAAHPARRKTLPRPMAVGECDVEQSTAQQSTAQLLPSDWQLPQELEASAPPEARGLGRDGVRLMVSYFPSNRIVHTQFNRLPEYFRAGDVMAINTSGTLNAALVVHRQDGTVLELHLSTHLPAELWTVELRRPVGNTTAPFYDGHPGETLSLPEGGSVTLHRPYQRAQAGSPAVAARLWIATLNLPGSLEGYLDKHGFPIRYGYVKESWPIDYYQTVYATERGSAEMPSAGRAFTSELITALVARGIQVAPLLLHTGVASLESHEPPYEEYYRVSSETAQMVNTAHAAGRRVIAVGTTVVRALETVTDPEGITYPGEGWTGLVITPERGLRAVDALLTGLHEPRASHLQMLEALAGRSHVQQTYGEALRERYLWHEFGDLHLIMHEGG